MNTDALPVETLAKEFYKELFEWYTWALDEKIGVFFPHGNKDRQNREEHLIRLIIRLIFVWFLKQKNLVPDEIFDGEKLNSLLKKFDPNSKTQDNYYRAILQNLFFAALNNKIENRDFASSRGKSQHDGVKTLYHYADEFSLPPEEVIPLFQKVPFLNGGLFECLDKDTIDAHGKNKRIYCDGFSNNKKHRAFVPNVLFFDENKGFFPLLKRYHFTVEENTPADVTVALDPELLGRVLENLLGTYNPETRETARKQTGSFYTPREIVHYMVDESLKAYLLSEPGFLQDSQNNRDYHVAVETLFSDGSLRPENLDKIVVQTIRQKLRNIKVLDPACGSGAFPMGVLNRIMAILGKLEGEDSGKADDLKLHLIENCIYGVDIQPIAVQISTLRLFISLICRQEPNDNPKENFGIKPLPNLGTKFVAANTLIGLAKKKNQRTWEYPKIVKVKNELLRVRREHLTADTAQKKKKYREKDKELQEKLTRLLTANERFAPEEARMLARWNPYDQNTSSPFFDAEWMFGIKEGFDVVIGNPPYLKEGRISKKDFAQYNDSPYYQGKMDLWYMFACHGIDLLKNGGHLCFIAANNWVTSSGAGKLRNKIISDTQIKQLVDFGNFMIFESASVQTMVMQFSKNCITDNYRFDYRKLAGDTKLTDALDLLNKRTNHKAAYLFPKITRNDLKDGFLTFSSDDTILEEMAKKGIFLTEGEIAQGIVPNPDVVNRRNIRKIPRSKIDAFNIKVGDGVFVLSEEVAEGFPPEEQKYIKPLYEPTEVGKYCLLNSNGKILYITKQNYKNDAPQIIEHLEKYREIMDERRENLNGRLDFFHLHWPRNSVFFEKGGKILSVRKCGKPTFAYTEKEAYVMMAVNVIKTNRFHLKYLVGLFNSKPIAFWLKNKGKMQGDHFQIDKEPLLQIPVFDAIAERQRPIISLVDKILFLKNNDNISVSAIVDNETIASCFEKVIDACVYEFYFEEEIKAGRADVLELVQKSLNKVSPLPVEQQILRLFEEWNDRENDVRNRMILQETKIQSVARILESTDWL
ncbi:MAG: N-6 DNA methylase [Planctomycetaceae bacterium]|nr:N-6 DNA methylase [Planctomycetaceae bacterium]